MDGGTCADGMVGGDGQRRMVMGGEKLRKLDTNGKSLKNKIEEFEAKVDGEVYEIVAGSETWFNEERSWSARLKAIICTNVIGGSVAFWVKDNSRIGSRGRCTE